MALAVVTDERVQVVHAVFGVPAISRSPWKWTSSMFRAAPNSCADGPFASVRTQTRPSSLWVTRLSATSEEYVPR